MFNYFQFMGDVSNISRFQVERGNEKNKFKNSPLRKLFRMLE